MSNEQVHPAFQHALDSICPAPAPEWDYASHLVALAFMQARLSAALRAKDYSFAAACLHNIRQHCDGIERWIKERESNRVTNV